MEDLRRALGVERISLFGFSYGTPLALSILRRWPDSIDRAVLAGTEGPGDTYKFPRTMERQLATLSAESGVDLLSAWERLLSRAGEQPLRVSTTVGGAARTVQLGPGGLQYLLRRDVGDTNDWPLLPAAIVQAAQGDPSLLSRVTGRRFSSFASGVNLMPLATDCASGATPERRARIASEEPSPLFGVMTNYPFPAVCAVLDVPVLPDAFRAAVRSRTPTLFISGTRDSDTPPAQAEAVAIGFSTHAHLVVENAGPESTLRPDEVRTAIVAFLDGEAVTSRRIAAPPIRFLPLDSRPR